LAAGTENIRNYRLALTAATLQTLKNALGLLGIGVPEKM
jgi:arginyl-tRNA synthetase